MSVQGHPVYPCAPRVGDADDGGAGCVGGGVCGNSLYFCLIFAVSSKLL